MVPTFAQKDIVDHLGIAPRTVAFWSDQGVLLPVEPKKSGGSGVHRRFVESEVDVAAILHQASPLKLPIGSLRDIATWIRRVQAAPTLLRPVLRFPDDTEFVRAVVEQSYPQHFAHNGPPQNSKPQVANGRFLPSKPISNEQITMIVSWCSYFSARHRPELSNENKIMMRVAPTATGWDGYMVDDHDIDNFNWHPDSAGFDFDCCIEVNLNKAFAPLHAGGD